MNIPYIVDPKAESVLPVVYWSPPRWGPGDFVATRVKRTHLTIQGRYAGCIDELNGTWQPWVNDFHAMRQSHGMWLRTCSTEGAAQALLLSYVKDEIPPYDATDLATELSERAAMWGLS